MTTTLIAHEDAEPVTLAELAPYTARNGDRVQAGCYGVSHGSGLLGELIRHATESWAGHAFIYVGNGQIVEAEPGGARITAAASHSDAVWNAHEPLTNQQRLTIVARANALIGTPYDWPAYVGFALEVLKLKTGAPLEEAFASDGWRVCSALVADCYARAGVDVDGNFGGSNLVSPADLYDRIAQQA